MKADRLQPLCDRLEEVCEKAIAPDAGRVDEEGIWPERGLRALQGAGFMGLNVPKSLGGHGEGMLALVIFCEQIARHCSSTALCYGMHSVASAVIAAKATPHQQENYLLPIAEGKHISTLALSESGTGSHIYLPETQLIRRGDQYIVRGEKQFVTNASRADSYVVSTLASSPSEAGEFSCLIVDKDRPGVSWGAPWRGFGMRGNESRSMLLKDAEVPAANLLGSEGEQIWYAFEVVVPFFLMAMSGTYLGIAQAALDLTVARVKSRQYSHSGETLASVEPIQHQVADLWVDVQSTRQLLYQAAELADGGDPSALQFLLASKVGVAKTAVDVTNTAMTLCGGSEYRENGRLSCLLRDARASHVMTPTTGLLKSWLGRDLLGRPLF